MSVEFSSQIIIDKMSDFEDTGEVAEYLLQVSKVYVEIEGEFNSFKKARKEIKAAYEKAKQLLISDMKESGQSTRAIGGHVFSICDVIREDIEIVKANEKDVLNPQEEEANEG